VSGGGDLVLSSPSSFAAEISGLASASQKIDLVGFGYSTSDTITWTQSGTSGTLSVANNSQSATLSLIGTYSTANFSASSDSNGGTYIYDPPLSAVPNTGAASVFDGGWTIVGTGDFARDGDQAAVALSTNSSSLGSGADTANTGWAIVGADDLIAPMTNFGSTAALAGWPQPFDSASHLTTLTTPH
jgi:hypothetical protein